MSKQTDDEWLASLTDDAAKVDYMKAKVAADAATEQTRIKETAATERAKVNDSSWSTNFTTYRSFIGGFILIATLGATIAWCDVAKTRDASETERLHVLHPSVPSPLPPPTTPSAAPSK